MKIRKCFVSNSSSSSFCLYGAAVSLDEIDRIADLIKKEDIEEECKKSRWVTPDHFNPESDDFSIDNVLDLFLKNKGLEYVYDGDGGCVYIGRGPSDIKDDETGLQFKESTHFLKKVFTNPDFGWHEGEISC
jgi:hypothetical protein